MKKQIHSLMAAAALSLTFTAGATVDHLLPKVKNLQTTSGQGFNFKQAVAIDDATDTELLREVLTDAGATVDDNASAKITVEIVESIPGAFNHNLPEYPDEAYSIDVTENEVAIKALTSTGVIRAAQTLAQLAIDADEFPACTLTDWPAFKLRGLMHDIGRSFISVDELKKELRLLSQFKVNTFHWHLTENQAWRFEVKAYPELTSDESMTRFVGCYYTQDQCREVMALAKKYGITVIPEIDMPGHCEAYVRAMGHAMQTTEGKEALKTILEEVADVFADAPYIHIGADEVTITDNTFLDTMIDKIHSLGKKVVCWNRINGVNIADHDFDMTQMWATSGTKVSGLPNIDCRYNYVNHFDVFADLVGIYKSNIYYEEQGTDDVAGTITAIWTDRKTPTEEDIVSQNNLYACTLASAERAWAGGGKQYIEVGGTMLPNSGEEYDEFADWERRFLLHKGLSLKDEPIPYVKQTHERWYVTEMFANGGDKDAAFGPELDIDNKTWSVTPVTGAGIYLRHTWGGTVPGLYGAAAINNTAYAYTYIYSPAEQTVGAQIEFQNYGRSEKDMAPDNGNWDRKGSRLWLNDTEIMPPTWDNAGKSISAEVDLLNENFPAREPLEVTLKQGWNKVLIKLPYVSASNVRLNKWMWTFALVDLTTGEAVEDIRYSPSMSIDDDAEAVATLIEEARTAITSVIQDKVGYYKSSSLDVDLLAKIEEVAATLSETMTAEQRQTQVSEIQALLDAFNSGYTAAGIVLPSENVFYQMYTPLRNSKYAAAIDSKLGSTTSPAESAAWKFVPRGDGSYNIINYATREYIAAASNSSNKQILLSDTEPATGWEVKPADAAGYVIVVNGTMQFNQSNSADIVLNWGDGTKLSDTGCKYVFLETDYSDVATVGLLNTLISTARAKVNEVIKEPVGYYPSTSLDQDLIAKIEEAEAVIADDMDTELCQSYYEAIQVLYYAFLTGYTANGVNQPQAGVYYNLKANQGSRYVSASGNAMYGVTSPTEESAWKFVERTDGDYDIINYVTSGYISPVATYNTALSLTDEAPADGWKVLASSELGKVIVVSGASQLNQTKVAQNYAAYNWGGGSNTTDAGCLFEFISTAFYTDSLCIPVATVNETTEIYDLQGRKLTAPVRGVNIVNGRKVLVK